MTAEMFKKVLKLCSILYLHNSTMYFLAFLVKIKYDSECQYGWMKPHSLILYIWGLGKIKIICYFEHKNCHGQ